MKRRQPGSSWRRFAIGFPYAWLVAFFLAPFLIVLKISLSQTAIAQPPYTPVLDLAAGWRGVTDFFNGLSFENYGLLGSDPLYLLSYVKSIEIAAFSTLMLLVVGLPIAYAIARTPRRWQAIFVLLVALPFWTSLLIRIYSWMNILQREGPLNDLLMGLGIVKEPPAWLATDTAIYIGVVYSYLPFMVLPLFATLEKLDHSLLEAAGDLGSPPWRAFLDVTLPLSMPGIIAGSMLVFIPAIGEFVIPTLLGGPNNLMIGRVLWDEFFGNRDWPVTSAVAIAFLVLLAGPIALYQHYSTKQLES